ncbi:hypothetical protein Hanom_Chr11g01043091 [Helianthus anomalus]
MLTYCSLNLHDKIIYTQPTCLCFHVLATIYNPSDNTSILISIYALILIVPILRSQSNVGVNTSVGGSMARVLSYFQLHNLTVQATACAQNFSLAFTSSGSSPAIEV